MTRFCYREVLFHIILLFTKEVLCYIEVANIEVTLYWLNPRMDFSHVHVPEAQKVLNRWNFLIVLDFA